MKLTRAARLGLVSGLLLIMLSLGIYRMEGTFEGPLSYIPYASYMAAVVLGQYFLFRSARSPFSFRDFFSEGFRIFIVVTLIMVLFTWIFLRMHPEINEEMASVLREEMTKSGNYTAEQITAAVTESKKNFITSFTSVAIFGYLMIGVLAACIGALFFTARSASARRK